MGTRHLTAVCIDGQYKIAQYGQWDGYPDGAGLTALTFARTLANKSKMDEFKKRVRAVQYLADNEMKQISRMSSESIQRSYPHLCRGVGADILDRIMAWECGIKLINNIEFAADSLMCEWAWVIDLDKNTFEGFKGFNKTKPLEPDDRFYFLRDKERDETRPGDKYYGVVLAAKWSLDNLPTDDEFLDAFEEKEEESNKADAPVSLSVKASISVELTPQDIDDIMTTALEGGITYWCGKTEVVGDYLGKYASDQISRGGTLKLYDIDDPDETWELSLAKLMNGVKMYIENGKCNCIEDGGIDVGNIDGESADCIIQYALFGKLVFG